MKWYSGWISGGIALAVLWVVLSLTRVMNPFEALVLCSLFYGCLFVSRCLPLGYLIAWPSKNRKPKDGAREEIAQLAWLLLGKHKMVTHGGMKQIRSMAANVFESVGIDLNEPAHRMWVENRMGRFVLDALTREQSALTQAQLTTFVSALESLEILTERYPLPPIEYFHNPNEVNPQGATR